MRPNNQSHYQIDHGDHTFERRFSRRLTGLRCAPTRKCVGRDSKRVPPYARDCCQRWWKSGAPESPPKGICVWAASCEAAPGLATTWALPGVCCTLTSAEAIGASPTVTAAAAMVSPVM